MFCDRRRQRAAVRGFTLIEVSVAAAVILISLVGLTGGAVAFQRASAHQRRATQAISALETITEELLAAQSSDPRLVSGSHTTLFDTQGRRVSSGGFYTVRWNVTASQPFAGQRRIRLRVSWQEMSQTRGFGWETHRR